MIVAEPTEQPTPAPIPELTEADIAWLETIPDYIQPVVRKHGRFMFSLAYNIGAIGEAAGNIQRRVAGNNEMMHNLRTLVVSADQITAALMAAKNINLKTIKDIQRDIELATALAGAEVNSHGRPLIILGR